MAWECFSQAAYSLWRTVTDVVYSPMWTNGGTPEAGAMTYALGNGGTVGPITAANSVRGMMNGGGGSMRFSHARAAPISWLVVLQKISSVCSDKVASRSRPFQEKDLGRRHL